MTIKTAPENKKAKIYLASNVPPPYSLIYMGANDVIFGLEARDTIKEIENWKSVRFLYNPHRDKFTPVLEQDRERKIGEFKYVIEVKVYGE